MKVVMREEVENEEEDRRRNVKAVGTGAAAVMMGLSVMAVATPALATVATTAAQVESFSSGLYSSLVLILASEIGDKTFFISALLAMKYSKSIVFLGSIFALGMMTVISVLIGQVRLPTPFLTSQNIFLTITIQHQEQQSFSSRTFRFLTQTLPPNPSLPLVNVIPTDIAPL